MIFYESWLEAANELTPKERTEAIMGIVEYGCTGVTPVLKGAPSAVFKMAKPHIDANNAKAQAGAKGGRPKKDANPTQRTAGKFINFTPSDTDWDAVADQIKEAQ